jgi:hypothetical protein
MSLISLPWRNAGNALSHFERALAAIVILTVVCAETHSRDFRSKELPPN